MTPGSGRSSGEDNGNPLQYSSGEFHALRSLAGYSLWGHKESDTSEQLTLLLQLELRRKSSHSAPPFLCLTFEIFRSPVFPILVSRGEEGMKQGRK